MRRLVIGGVILEAALLIIGLTWVGPMARGETGSTGSDTSGVSVSGAPFRIFGAGEGRVVEVTLKAEEVVQTLAEGVDAQVWTFNGTAPGPVIRVQVGDTIRFKLVNASTHGLSHSMDFHAAQTPWDRDYQPVAPGETGSFDWVARFPGVFMYHCGVPPVLQHIANGMYGAIVVEPEGLTPAREYVLVASEFYTGTTPGADGVPEGELKRMQEARPTYVVFDGGFNRYLDAPLVARPGEPIRLWVMNAGPTLTTAFHVIGALFDHVYPDGNPTNALNGLQTYNIAPGSGAMFELTIPDAGLYPFVTHSFAYTGLGSVGVLKIAEDVVEAPTSYPRMGDPFSGGVLPEGSTPGQVAAAPDGGADSAMVEMTITGYSPNDVMAKEGDVLHLVNLDAFEHNMAFEGTDIVWTLGANETLDQAVDLPPGTYTFYCSIVGHRESGMEGTITVMSATAH